MTRISDIDPILPENTKEHDLFVVVSVDLGEEGTRVLTRKQLAQAIQYETFENIKISGGELANVTIKHANLVYPNFNINNIYALDEEIADDDFFLLKNVSQNKVVALPYSELQSIVKITDWIPGRTYSIGDFVYSTNTNSVYRAKTYHSGSSINPSGDSTNWESILSKELIKTLYESNADTNVFTDAEKTKLTLFDPDGTQSIIINSWVSGTTYNIGQLVYSTITHSIYKAKTNHSLIDIDPSSDTTNWETLLSANLIKTLYESNADTNVFTDIEKSKLASIEEGATGDQTPNEIKTFYESNADTNAFTDTEKSKLGILDRLLPIEEKSETDYVASVSDVAKYIRMTSDSAITFTIPGNVFSAGDEMIIEQAGLGTITFVAGVDMVINSLESKVSTAGQYGYATIKFISPNQAILGGSLS